MKSKFLPKFAGYGVFVLVVAAAMTGSYVYRGISPVNEALAGTNMPVAVTATTSRTSATVPCVA